MTEIPDGLDAAGLDVKCDTCSRSGAKWSRSLNEFICEACWPVKIMEADGS